MDDHKAEYLLLGTTSPVFAATKIAGDYLQLAGDPTGSMINAIHTMQTVYLHQQLTYSPHVS